MDATTLSNRVFTKLRNQQPTMKQQAQMFLDAMEEYIQGGTKMYTQEVNQKYVEFTGAKKDLSNVQASGVVGRYGEVVIFESMNKYFENPKIQARYGMHVMEGTANVMIPADESKAGQTKAVVNEMLHPLIREAQSRGFTEWKRIFPKSETMPDFFMQNAFPVEVKAKINSYIFFSDETGSRQHKPKDVGGIGTKNPHFKGLLTGGSNIMVGGVWVDTFWRDITEDLEPFKDWEEATINALKTKETAIGQSKGNITVKIDLTLPKERASKYAQGRLYEMIGVKIASFIPMATNKKVLAQLVRDKGMRRSDMGALEASAKFTAEMLLSMITAYEDRIR